ncbi:MAG TPA: hypothetical protein VMV95_03640 [Bacillota bacterium]|nr:hypothetical protein [Bacillota bacterium]
MVGWKGKEWCKLSVSNSKGSDKLVINLRKQEIKALGLNYKDVDNFEYKREVVPGEIFIRIYIRNEGDHATIITKKDMERRKAELGIPSEKKGFWAWLFRWKL